MTVHIDQIRAAYDALGLPAEAWNATTAINITPHEVRHTVHVLSDTGGVQLGPLGGPVSETVEHDVERYDQAELAALEGADL